MNSLTILLAACTLGVCPAESIGDNSAFHKISIESPVSSQNEAYVPSPLHTGDYLSSQFAQYHHDWNSANVFIQNILGNGVSDVHILKRAMILAMGSGDGNRAVDYAKRLVKAEPQENNIIAQIILVMDAFRKNDQAEISALIAKLPADGSASFIGAFLEGWGAAQRGELRIENMQTNVSHLYHAILIADYLKREDQIEALLDKMLVSEDIKVPDIERIADIYAHIGKKEKALDLYGTLQKSWPENTELSTKITYLTADKDSVPFQGVENPHEGVAMAFNDISKILFQEHGDESARVFAHMALLLNPNLDETKFLLAYIATRHGRYEDAIAQYASVSAKSDHYIEARSKTADILKDMDRVDEALGTLQTLVDRYNDIDALIKMGNMQRERDNFAEAVNIFNQASLKMDNKIPADYWHLHYVRGMAYERMGNWDAAERDLKAALAFQPEHPYILNYLAYAWADRGLNLKESLEMVKKAAALRPADGYITDSVGWVMYRMNDYKGAVPHLEKAAQLLPYDSVINDHLGDAYWKVGRKLEAKFQWERAKNHSEDEKLRSALNEKLTYGMIEAPHIVGANTTAQ